MRWTKKVTMVEAHAEGEVGRVVTESDIEVPGADMAEKLAWMNSEGDALRRFLVFEPRGAAQMSTLLTFPPTRTDADIGFLVLQPDRTHAMSGSNAICLTTVLLETGRIKMREPETIVRIDSAAGLVTATAQCRAGKCERVSLTMTPSFAERLGARIEVEGMGEVQADIAFGGVFYALVDAQSIGLRIVPQSARELVDAGSRIQRVLNAGLDIRHPEIAVLDGIAYVMFTSRNEAGELVGATIMPPGRIDRSPCGTGNSARLAVAAAKGEATPGDQFIARSIIGSRFDVEFVEETNVAGRKAIVPRISGRGFIHGVHQIGLDPADPFPAGYFLSDTWGDASDLLR